LTGVLDALTGVGAWTAFSGFFCASTFFSTFFVSVVALTGADFLAAALASNFCCSFSSTDNSAARRKLDPIKH